MIKQTKVNQFLNPIKGSNAKTLSIELEEMEKMRLRDKILSKWNICPNGKLSYREITSFNQIYHAIRCNIAVKIFSDRKSGEFKIFYGREISSYWK